LATASPPHATSRSAQPVRGNSAWSSRDIVRVALLVAGVWLGLELLWVARSVFVLAFLGTLFGLTLSAAVTWLASRGIPRPVGALLVVLAVLAVLTGLGAIVAPRIGEQVQQLQDQLPGALGQAESWLQARQGWLAQILHPAAHGGGAPQAQGGGLRANLAQQIAGLSSHFFSIFSSAMAVLGSLILILFIAIFIAVEPRTYRRGIMHLVPHESRPKASQVLDAMAVTLRRWLGAQLIGMLVIGSVTTVVLLLLGVRAAIALGIIAGLLEFIPYFGPILSAVPAVAMAFLDGPELALWVVVAYLAIQQLEGNLLMPVLMKEGLDLPPALTIVAQAALALVFGFVGLLIAVPLLGTVMVPIKLLYVQDVVGDDVPLPGES
jgi:predicted PurR-regulated permease PerM